MYLTLLTEESAGAPDQDPDLPRRARDGVGHVARLARTFGNLKPRAALLRAELWRLRGRPRKALQAAATAARLATVMDMPFERARALLELGRLDPSSAATGLAEAEAILRRLGAGYQLGRLATLQRQVPVPVDAVAAG